VAQARPKADEAKVTVTRDRKRRERGCRTRARCWYHRRPRDKVQLAQAMTVDQRSGHIQAVGLAAVVLLPREPIILRFK
jgi:hypothetical protein